jgi:hypothetical protein
VLNVERGKHVFDPTLMWARGAERAVGTRHPGLPGQLGAAGMSLAVEAATISDGESPAESGVQSTMSANGLTGGHASGYRK